MAATATIRTTGTYTSLPEGGRTVGPFNLTSADANGTIQTIELANGANTITPPTSPATSGCIIILPATNTQVTTLKGVSGDTGIALGKTTTTILNWDSTAAPSTFVLTSAAAQTGKITEIIYF